MQSNRRSFLKRNLAIGTGLLLANSVDGLAAASKQISTQPSSSENINIRYTNDIKGQISPVVAQLGGLEALKRTLNRTEEQGFLFDAGGFIGTNQSFSDQLKAIDLINSLNYHGLNISPNELSLGVEHFSKLVPYFKVPLISANYQFSSPVLSRALAKYIIFDYAGYRIGVTGVGAELDMQGLKSTDPNTALQEVSAILKNKQHCDLIICLTHLQDNQKNNISNRSLAALSKNVDLFIGGQASGQPQGLQVLKNASGYDAFLSNNQQKAMELATLTFSMMGKGNQPNLILTNEIPGLCNSPSLAKVNLLFQHNNQI